jgi:hypothetical protein
LKCNRQGSHSRRPKRWAILALSTGEPGETTIHERDWSWNTTGPFSHALKSASVTFQRARPSCDRFLSTDTSANEYS